MVILIHKGTTNNLLHLSVMDVYTWSEFHLSPHHFLHVILTSRFSLEELRSLDSSLCK